MNITHGSAAPPCININETLIIGQKIVNKMYQSDNLNLINF